jgi:hypothetical protein
LVILLGLPGALLPSVGRAQDGTAERALAEMLYRQGRALLVEGKASEACLKFAESYRLDPATGTLLNLASCHETERKYATAWLEFSRAVAFARRDRRQDRVQFAQEHLAALEPKLSYLTVVVPVASDVPGLDVRVDGVPVHRAARGVSTPVDPGSHTVEASAPGRKPWSQPITIPEDATNVTVLSPTLEPSSPTVVPASEPSQAAVPTHRPIPTSVYVSGAVTLALAAGAGVTAYVYMKHRADEGAEQREPELGQNRRLGAVNVVLDVGALLGAGVTAYLYWTRPTEVSRPSPAPPGGTARLGFVPWIAPAGGGLCIQGSL